MCFKWHLATFNKISKNKIRVQSYLVLNRCTINNLSVSFMTLKVGCHKLAIVV